MSEETKHSPEPWVVFDAKYPGIDAANGDGVVFHSVYGNDGAGVWGGWDGNTDPAANARRIVACVNSCAGIPTEALESGALAELVAAAQEYGLMTSSRMSAALRRLGKLP